jgi:arsenite-transporting ATPase
MAGMMGMAEMNADDMTRKLEEMLPVIRDVNEQFMDPVSTNFLTVCVYGS